MTDIYNTAFHSNLVDVINTNYITSVILNEIKIYFLTGILNVCYDLRVSIYMMHGHLDVTMIIKFGILMSACTHKYGLVGLGLYMNAIKKLCLRFMHRVSLNYKRPLYWEKLV